MMTALASIDRTCNAMLNVADGPRGPNGLDEMTDVLEALVLSRLEEHRLGLEGDESITDNNPRWGW
jgi:hypothetical protein